MSFTKRDFEAVARIIARSREDLRDETAISPTAHAVAKSYVDNIAADLSRHFASGNPRFDPLRFARACEPGPRQHIKVPHGRCPICLHYGDDCTGREVRK